ncbi:ABC transporter ATP-binding protein [Sneathiella chinensis]|uniref:ABC transporter n=1 Tax=Sneathiella chinensis TaxID=349750 RepID=A0ABQ5U772_9PROT|nr:ABC transporter ATP-binding protein [Sneathiella chinensis]GLQ07104.1 ABC transporter [Sneathiella chinensis]
MVAYEQSSPVLQRDVKNNSSETGAARVSTPSPLGVDIHLATLGYQDTIILEDLRLTLHPGRITCLLGPSGVGKTSILKSLAGFLPLSKGSRIECSDGKPLAGRISYMDQNDLTLPWASVLDNLVIAARLSGKKPDFDRARHLLETVGLAGKEALLPSQLSGGMKQRVALARTLMDDNPLVLVDEPFSALDAITRHRLQDLTVSLLSTKTVLMITHDPLEALRMGHHIHVLSGDPVRLSDDLNLTTPVPRDPTGPDITACYNDILALLNTARTEELS